MPKYPQSYSVKIKRALKTSDFIFYLNSLCVDLIFSIWIRYVKNDFVKFEFKFFNFQPWLVLKLNASAHENNYIFFVLIKYFNLFFPYQGYLTWHIEIWYRLLYVGVTLTYWFSTVAVGSWWRCSGWPGLPSQTNSKE